MSIIKRFSLICSLLLVPYTTNADEECICPVNSADVGLRQAYTLSLRASQGVQSDKFRLHRHSTFDPYGRYSDKGRGQVKWIRGSWGPIGPGGFQCNDTEEKKCYKVEAPAYLLNDWWEMQLRNSGIVRLTGASNATLEPTIWRELELGGRYIIKYAKTSGIGRQMKAIFYTRDISQRSPVPSSANAFTYRGLDSEPISDELQNDF